MMSFSGGNNGLPTKTSKSIQHQFVQEVTLNIVVCIKQVPDSAAKVVAQEGQATWGDAPLVMNPWDEYAVETALVLQEKHGGEVTVVSIGGETVPEALKTGLAMGCNSAVHINDPGLENADSQAVARVLATAIDQIGDIEIALFGKQAIDGDMGVTAAQTARVLGWPVLSLASSVSVADGKIRVERNVEEGRQVVEGPLPAAVSVVKDIGEPRYPSFMGIRKASRATIPVWTLADLDIDAPPISVRWPEITNPPVSEVTNEIISGDSPEEIAKILADKIIEEKVL